MAICDHRPRSLETLGKRATSTPALWAPMRTNITLSRGCRMSTSLRHFFGRPTGDKDARTPDPVLFDPCQVSGPEAPGATGFAFRGFQGERAETRDDAIAYDGAGKAEFLGRRGGAIIDRT